MQRREDGSWRCSRSRDPWRSLLVRLSLFHWNEGVSTRKMKPMFTYNGIEALFAQSTPPRAGSTQWYDACDLLATAVKGRLRELFDRGFHVEVYGDEVSVILRVRGDGCGVEPWSVDRSINLEVPLDEQVNEAVAAVAIRVAEAYA